MIVKEIYNRTTIIFVRTRIIFMFLILGGITIASAFAASLITVETNSNSYKEGDIVIISGDVSTIIANTPITMQIFNQGNIVDVAQITVAEDGSYSHTVRAEGPLWSKSGNYTVSASYGVENVAETQFNFSPKSEVPTTDIFEVDAGSYGTFDVNYSINGGIVKNMMIDKDNLALIVIIEAENDGNITLEMPRSAFDAKKQDLTDDIFIILIDKTEASYQETVTNTDSRIITINFEEGNSDIEIIGTTIIPEFGTIAAMILAIGITTTIIVTRNRFQIHV